MSRALLVFLLFLGSVSAQTPEPSAEPSIEPANIVQAPADSAPSEVSPAPTGARSNDSDFAEEITALQQLRAANEELLEKQQAAIQLLDELQRDADQLRIFTKRG